MTTYALSTNWRPVAISLFTSCLLTFFWLAPSSSGLWNAADLWTFRLLNGSLINHPLWAKFWALANADLADRLMEFLVFGCAFLALRKKSIQETKRVFVHFLSYYILLTLSALLFKYAIHHGLEWRRLSPTKVLSECFRLSSLLSIKVKDASRSSFPADHALFLMLMMQYAKRKFDSPFRKAAWAITIFFCLPRLISGGHWLTDIVFGAILPSWVFASLVLDTLLVDRISRWLYSKFSKACYQDDEKQP